MIEMLAMALVALSAALVLGAPLCAAIERRRVFGEYMAEVATMSERRPRYPTVKEMNECENMRRVFTSNGETPCECLRWEFSTEVPGGRRFIMLRSWSAIEACTKCRGTGAKHA